LVAHAKSYECSAIPSQDSEGVPALMNREQMLSIGSETRTALMSAIASAARQWFDPMAISLKI
jgi:hypothetical protein